MNDIGEVARSLRQFGMSIGWERENPIPNWLISQPPHYWPHQTRRSSPAGWAHTWSATATVQRMVVAGGHERFGYFGFLSANADIFRLRAGGSFSLAPSSLAMSLLGSMMVGPASLALEGAHRATAMDQSDSISTQVVARTLLVSPNLIQCVSTCQFRTFSVWLGVTGLVLPIGVGEGTRCSDRSLWL